MLKKSNPLSNAIFTHVCTHTLTHFMLTHTHTPNLFLSNDFFLVSPIRQIRKNPISPHNKAKKTVSIFKQSAFSRHKDVSCILTYINRELFYFLITAVSSFSCVHIPMTFISLPVVGLSDVDSCNHRLLTIDIENVDTSAIWVNQCNHKPRAINRSNY